MRDNKKRKRLTALTLILSMMILLLAGCGGKEGDGDKGENRQDGTGPVKAGTGRFMEEEITLPEGIRRIRSLKKLSDGSLEAVGEADEAGNYFILKSSDSGRTWASTRIDALGKEYRPETAIAPDGTVILISYIKEGKASAKIADERGKTKDLVLSFPDAGSGKTAVQLQQAAYSAEGTLILLDTQGTLYEAEPDGTCRKAYDTDGIGIHYFGISEQILMAVHGDGIMLFHTKEKKRLDSETVLDDLIKKNSQLASSGTDRGYPVVFSTGNKTDSVMLAWEDGIFHFTRGGSVMEQLADGSLTSLGGGSVTMLDMAVVDDANIFVALFDDERDKIFHYSYDKTAAAVPDQELSVYALDDSVYLRKAVKLFQKNNPDIHVRLEFGLSGGDGVTVKDALSVLSTNILAKKGPDVLILDGMPADSYIEKGILSDITGLVDEIDKKDGIFPGILEGSKRDGKIYAMPARFLFSVVEGDRDTVAAGGTLSALAERGEELAGKKSGGSVLGMGRRTLLRNLYYADSASWQKEDGTLDENALRSYLDCAGRIYKNTKKKERDFQDQKIGDGTLNGEKLGTVDSMGLISRECQISFGSLSGIFDLQTMRSAEVQSKADYGLLNGEKVKSYIPYLMAGIVEGGNTVAAKAFVRELLGRRAGNSASNGIPVNRAAYDAVCKEKLDAQNVKDKASVSAGTQGGEHFGFSYVNLTREDEDKFTKIVESLVKPSMTDRVIQEMVLEQGDKYLRGEQTLEKSVEEIGRKVNLYLSE